MPLGEKKNLPAWRDFQINFSRPLFTIIFRPKIVFLDTDSILRVKTTVEWQGYSVLNILGPLCRIKKVLLHVKRMQLFAIFDFLPFFPLIAYTHYQSFKMCKAENEKEMHIICFFWHLQWFMAHTKGLKTFKRRMRWKLILIPTYFMVNVMIRSLYDYLHWWNQ